DVGDGDDPRGKRDLLALLAVRVPLAVPALVVLARDPARGLEEARLAEHRLAIDAVLLDDVELGVGKVVLCLQDVVGSMDLADVVHDARVPELLHERAGKTEPLRDRFDVPPDAEEVLAGRPVLQSRREQQVADALEARAAELLVRDALLLERALELLSALALRAEHLGEVLCIPAGLLLHERHLVELRLEL